MTIVGYARVSTGTQDYSSQVARLQAAGATKIYMEKRSGLDGDRAELRHCLEWVRDGDTLLVTKIDRLARSASDLYRIVSTLSDKEVEFRVLDDTAVDTTTRHGKLMLGILAVIAEFETDIRRERQAEGIARAKAEGRTGGRPLKVTAEKRADIARLQQGGNRTVREIASEVSLSKSTVHKVLQEEIASLASRA